MAEKQEEPKRLLVIFNEGISEDEADFRAAVIMTGLEYEDVDVLLVDNATFDRIEQPRGSVKVKMDRPAPKA
jgi:hypothetical protein